MNMFLKKTTTLNNMNENSTPPVLFIIFNRPDLVNRVFNQIRKAQPMQLFIHADGPRNEQEIPSCEEARAIVNQIDWDCEIHTLFRDHNIGLKKSFHTSIAWFFEHVEEGIILEDDVVPHPSFFRYCCELLDYYRTENRVMMIGGNSVQLGRNRTTDSYYFSTFSHIKGWATWRRAWQLNDTDLKTWPENRGAKWIKEIMIKNDGVKKITQKIDEVYNGKLSSWGYGWQYSIWMNRGFCVAPTQNLVTDIGFDERGTHTKQNSPFANLEAEEMTFPLRHPEKIIRNLKADKFIVNHLILRYPLPGETSLPKAIYARLRNKIPRPLRWRLDHFLFYQPKP